MSFFSDINGFNKKAMTNNYENKSESNTDFSEVDFCVNKEDKNAPNNIFGNFNNKQEIKENYMYNFDLTEKEAEEYINKHFTDEG